MQPNFKATKSNTGLAQATIKKNQTKYVPTQEEAQVIKAYFLYNNFQDFNTWQQISKSKCEFEFTELKNDVFQCKAILKWDDQSMPIIVQTAESRNKRNSKKKALYKLVESLIYNGLISFGFRNADFVSKLPKRRREVSDSESQQLEVKVDIEVLQIVQKGQISEILPKINYKNFQYLACKALSKSDLHIWRKVLQALQSKQFSFSEGRPEGEKIMEELKQEPWQDYCERQFKETLDEDLTDFLRYYQLQLPQANTEPSAGNIMVPSFKPLPSEEYFSAQSNKILQSFHPIEAGLCLEKKLKSLKLQKVSRQKSFFADLQKRIPLPNFQLQDSFTPIPHSVFEDLLEIVLEYSYNGFLAHQALCILEQEVQSVSLSPKEESKGAEEYYLKHKMMLTAQFSYLLGKKTRIPAVSLEGMLEWQGSCYVFTPKEPEQIVQRKIAKKTNINEMEQMSEFTTEEYVLLVSKINSSEIYIGQLLQAYAGIRIKCHSLLKQNSQEKHPFTMLKLANAKLYNRVSKAISHICTIQNTIFNEQTVIIEQPPTYPIVGLIGELLAEWLVLRQTILIITEHVEELHAALIEKGFKVVKINAKTEEKHITKAQIVCCSPAAACADVIRNYAFTRVIIEGAHRVSETMCLLPMDKGSQKVFLIGDLKLTEGLVFSPFAKDRGMATSLMARLKEKSMNLAFSSIKKQHTFDASILQVLRKYFYGQVMDSAPAFQSPLVKGFPWPSSLHRVVYIHIEQKSGEGNYLNKQAEFCCRIVSNILKSGFIKAKDIGCRVISPNAQAILQLKLSQLYKNCPWYDVKPEDSFRDVNILTGSRLKQRDLSIILCENKTLHKSYLNSCLQEGRRGVIIIGNLNKLKEDSTWCCALEDGKKQKLILSAEGQLL